NDGKFYGTTASGGSGSLGTIFEMDSLGNITPLHSFTESEGCRPLGGLVKTSNSTFYGTASGCGTSNLGVLYRMDIGATTTGTINVTTNLAAATFNINGDASTGNVAYAGSGTSFIQTNALAGTYTILFNALSGYFVPPVPAQNLTAGGTITFNGQYMPLIP